MSVPFPAPLGPRKTSFFICVSCTVFLCFAVRAVSSVNFFLMCIIKQSQPKQMQARKHTISDQPWFCRNQVYAWLPDYNAMRSHGVAEIRVNNHIVSLQTRIKNLELELSDYYNELYASIRNGAEITNTKIERRKSLNTMAPEITYSEATDYRLQ